MAYIITERCVKCGACEGICPNKAIKEEEEFPAQGIPAGDSININININ